METLSYCQLMQRCGELEAQVKQPAAENAALKSTCDDRRTFIMNGVQLGYIKVPTVETDPALETIRHAVSPQEPTPATDAILASLRAEGVEMCIRALVTSDDDDFSDIKAAGIKLEVGG